MWLRRKSYEVLPALSVRQAELRRSMRLITAAWGFGIIWMTCVSGSWMNSFKRMMGFRDWHFGLLAALPHVAMVGNLVATILIERTGLRKYLFILTMGTARMLWAVVAVLFVTLAGRPVGVWLVMLTLTASWFLSALGTPAWFTWMGDLIPRRIRGRYLATRQRITRLLQFPVAITLAVVMDRVIDETKPFTPADQPRLLWALGALFVIAAVFGTLDICLFFRIREVRPTTRGQPPAPAVDIRARRRGRGPLAWLGFAGRYLVEVVRQLLIEPLGDRVFRRYVLYGATMYFAMAVGGPFYIRNMRENLGFSHLGVGVMFMVLGPIVSILAVRRWGRLIDRWGRRPMLMLATGLACFGTAPYFFASRYTPNPTWLTDAVNAAWAFLADAVGIEAAPLLSPAAPVGAWLVCATTIFFGFAGWSGVMLGQQGIILGFSESPGRSKYVAAHAVLLAVGGVLGGLVGGQVAEQIGSAGWYHPVRVGPYFEWNNWHATFLLSTLARITGFLWLIGMPDPGARRARDMMRTIGIEITQFAVGRLLLPWRLVFGPTRRRHSR